QDHRQHLPRIQKPSTALHLLSSLVNSPTLIACITAPRQRFPTAGYPLTMSNPPGNETVSREPADFLRFSATSRLGTASSFYGKNPTLTPREGLSHPSLLGMLS